MNNQIDYIAINQRYRNAIHYSKVYPSAYCGSDHIPVICHMRIKLKTLGQPKNNVDLQFALLHEDLKMKEEYAVGVKNRYESLANKGKAVWESLKESMVISASDLIPKKGEIMKQKWMTEEMLQLMKNKQKMKNRKSLEYRTIENEIKRQCRIAKETWYNRKCKEIEKNPYEIYKKIDEIRGKRKYCSASGCMKGKQYHNG